MTFLEIQQRLSNVKIGIAGCGGLGSNCASSLVRVGVRNLVIADFDVIVESNLNRQFFFFHQIGQKKVTTLKENLLLINPYCQIEAHDIKLTPDDICRLYYNCDIIVEAFDKSDQKKMLIETVLSNFPEKKIIAASGLAGWGNFENIKIQRYDPLIICGDMESEVSDNLPPIAPRVNIVSNLQADIIITEILSDGFFKPHI